MGKQMATRSLRLVINIENGQLLPFIDDLTGANAPRFVIGDKQPIEIYLVKPSSSTAAPQVVLPVPPGSTIKTAIGVINKTPTAGEWFLSYDGDETEALSATCTAAQLQTALNALASITAIGGVTVSTLGTQFNITFNNPGDRLAFISRNESLFPASVIQQQVLQNGTVSTSEVVLVNLAVRPIALLDTYTDPAAPAGSVSGNIYQITGSYRKAGTYRLQITWSDTAAKSVWTDPIAVTDSMSTVSQKIFDAMTFGGWGRDIKIDAGGTLATTVNNWGLSVTATDTAKWRVDFVKPVYEIGTGIEINPYAGKFTIGYQGNYTGELDAKATAEQVQTALNGLASIIAAGGVVVKKDEGQMAKAPNDGAMVIPYRPQNQQFIVTFNTPGARDVLVINPLSLYPVTTPEVAVQQIGTGSLAEVVTFKLVTTASKPVATMPVIAAIDVSELPYLPAKCGDLDLGTAEAIAYLGTKESQNAILEVQLDTAGQIQTLCQASCTVLGQVIADAAYAPQTLESAMSETVANARFVRRDTAQSPTDGEQDIIWANLGVTTQDGRDVADAITASSTPTAANPFATIADLPAGYDQSLNTTNDVSFNAVSVAANLAVGGTITASSGWLSVYGSGFDTEYRHEQISMAGSTVLTPTALQLDNGNIALNPGQGLLISDGLSTIQVEAAQITFPDTTQQVTAFKTDWSGSYQFADISVGASIGPFTQVTGSGITYPDSTSQESAPVVSTGTVIHSGGGGHIDAADYPNEIRIVIGGVTYAMPARIV